MVDTLPTAAEAYRASRSAENERTQRLLSIVTKYILETIKTEATSVSLPYAYISNNVKKILEDKGYKVTYHSDSQGAGDSYTISWHQAPSPSPVYPTFESR